MDLQCDAKALLTDSGLSGSVIEEITSFVEAQYFQYPLNHNWLLREDNDEDYCLVHCKEEWRELYDSRLTKEQG
ncbi:MAG: hypothetical protein HQ568_02515 [Calditrichaeota bacterium]|nr:hypothetical protein [Calditrichota bacterium]